ncbi:MAG: FAD:protein FMN transferase [Planctomycetaceae bacterium]
MWTRKLCPVAPVCCLLVAVGVATAAEIRNDSSVVLSGDTMGTYYQIHLPRRASLNTRAIQSGVRKLLNQIEDQMSTWRPESELSRFNASRSTDWFEVSPETVLVVTESLRIAELSGGAFDPTAGPVIDLWSFGSGKHKPRIPTSEEIAVAQQLTGWRKMQVREDPPALRKSQPELRLNLSAIAKGYGVDAVSNWLVSQSEENHLVEIGGEDRARGLKPDHTPWRIGVTTPGGMPAEQVSGPVFQVVELRDRSIATSGDYRNFFEIDGRRYSHTIDPATGCPILHDVASVSVLSDSCMAADGWATALTVLGPEKGLALAQAHHLGALMIVRDQPEFRVLETQEWTVAAGTPDLSVAQPADSPSVFRTVLAAGIVFAIALAGMAVGVIFSNKRIRGSCGGLANLSGQEASSCDVCETPSPECRQKMDEARQESGAPAEDSPAAGIRDREQFNV